MIKHNQKYWIEQYSNKKIIEQWFKDWLTYINDHIHQLQNLEELKQQYIKNEYIQIKSVLNTERNQKKAYNFLKKIIENMEV